MAAEENLREWTMRQADPHTRPLRIVDIEDLFDDGIGGGGSADQPAPPDQADAGGNPESHPSDRRTSRGSSFWLIVALGLMPVIAVAAGLIGYLIAVDGDDAVRVGDVAATPTETTVGPAAPQISSGTPAETRATVATSATTVPAAPIGDVVATGSVIAGVIELAGALPAERQPQWSAEIAELARVLDYQLVDRTEVAGPGATSAELTVQLPGLVVYRVDSGRSFDNNPHSTFDAIAGVLNEGTAKLNIVSYADPTDPDAAILSLDRSKHVHEHLVELGVDPARLVIESRSLADAPPGADDSPVERRTDVEFVYTS